MLAKDRKMGKSIHRKRESMLRGLRTEGRMVSWRVLKRIIMVGMLRIREVWRGRQEPDCMEHCCWS